MFIDTNSKVDREGLRVYVYSRLKELKQQATYLTIDKKFFWDKVLIAAKKHLSEEENQKVVVLVNQLICLPGYIDGWINLAVDSSERFEFFVLTKAHEIQSGNQEHDYFWALQIRHDQLVALVRIIEMLLDKMTLWQGIRADQIFEDSVFAGLTDCGVEDQVYLEAEKIYKERTEHLTVNK